MTAVAPRPAAVVLAVFACAATWVAAPAALGQDSPAPADSLAAVADSLEVDADDAGPGQGYPPPGGYRPRDDRAAEGQDAAAAGFFSEFENTPKAGVKATVQQYQYYGEWQTYLAMREGASVDNTLGWSWADYRKQDKSIERRNNQLIWNAGSQLPFSTNVTGNWDWSEDKTVNSAGVANLVKRDFLQGNLNLSKTRLRTGSFIHTLKGAASIADQKSLNQSQRNDFTEATANAGAQSGWNIAEGLTVAGRAWGSTTSGDRSLGETTSPSSADGDTLGIGVYYAQSWAAGRVHISRANFHQRYLDYRRNSNGLIDTVGIAEDQKIVQELETKDAVAIEFENSLRLGRLVLDASLARDLDQQDYAASGVGLKERHNDQVALGLKFAAGRDSFTVDYDYLWKWDDQRIKGATTNRGRQYVKSRDFSFGWYRELFRATELEVKLHQGLNQDIAQNQFNENDKDRLETDMNASIERSWSDFRTQLAFSYKQTQDISIRASRSSNNNTKDSYEIAPGYTWDLTDWLRLTQSYRLYIQYTDYDYSYLESVTREDDYNKRGNLNTRLTIDATERLELTIRHDYNKRFNATKISEDASGAASYFKDQIQTINKIDLGLAFEAAEGVVFNAATYRSKDIKDSFGRVERRTTTFSGEIWVGCQVKKKWGRKNPLELSALVRKFNAFGPSVTATSADYWEADVWLKWSF